MTPALAYFALSPRWPSWLLAIGAVLCAAGWLGAESLSVTSLSVTSALLNSGAWVVLAGLFWRRSEPDVNPEPG